MSDEKKPEHPAPWRWEDTAYGHPDISGFERRAELVDANGNALVFAEEEEDGGLMVARLAKELIRLAPELESMLRTLAGYDDREDGLPLYSGDRKDLERIIAALDAARRSP